MRYLPVQAEEGNAVKHDLGLDAVRGRLAEIWCTAPAVNPVEALPSTAGSARAA